MSEYEGIVEVISLEQSVGDCVYVNNYLGQGWVLLHIAVTYDVTAGRPARGTAVVYVLGRKADAEESE